MTREELQQHLDEKHAGLHLNICDTRSHPTIRYIYGNVGFSCSIDQKKDSLSSIERELVVALEKAKAMIEHSIIQINTTRPG